MAFPTPKVYIAFNDGPYVASPTWTDVSSYVYSANIHRGRSDDYSNVVGTAHVVLNNNSRLFDPWNTAGTYYGKLLPRRQIKIEGVSGGSTFGVFRGFIAAWPAYFDNAGKAGTVSLECFDGLALLAQEQMPVALDLYTKSLSPFGYYHLNDPQGSQVLTDSISGNNLLKSGSDFISRPSMNSNLLGTSAFLPYGSAFTNTTTAYSASAGSVSFWTNATDGYPTGVYTKIGPVTISVTVNPTNTGNTPEQRLQVLFIPATSAAALYTYYTLKTPVGSFQYNTPHHVVCTIDQPTNTFKIYIDSVLQTTTQTTYSDYSGGNDQSVGITGAAQYQELSVYNYVLSQAQVTALYNGASNVYVETTAARFSRIMGYTSYPSALTASTSTPVATLSNISIGGTNLATELATVNTAEGGVMYVSKTGVVTFQDRNYVYTNTKSNTVQATFATASIPYEPEVAISYSGDQLRNVYQVTYSGGGQYTASNDASVTAYGRNATAIDTQLSTVAQAVTLAAYDATVGGQLLSDVSPVAVGVTAATTDWTTLLGMELFERYTITINPATGSAFSQTQLINSVTHSIVPGYWKMTVDGSARFSSWFILDKSVLNGTDLLQ